MWKNISMIVKGEKSKKDFMDEWKSESMGRNENTSHKFLIDEIRSITKNFLDKECTSDYIVELLDMPQYFLYKEYEKVVEEAVDICIKEEKEMTGKVEIKQTRDKEFIIGKKYTSGNRYVDDGWGGIFVIKKKTEHFYFYDYYDCDPDTGEIITTLAKNYKSKKIIPMSVNSKGMVVKDKKENIVVKHCWDAEEYFKTKDFGYYIDDDDNEIKY